MQLAERGPEQLTLQEAARVTLKSTKSIRRAATIGELPRCYAFGPRGRYLIFDQDAVLRWATQHGHTVRRARPSGTAATTVASDLSSIERLVSLHHHALEELTQRAAQSAALLHDLMVQLTTLNAQVTARTLLAAGAVPTPEIPLSLATGTGELRPLAPVVDSATTVQDMVLEQRPLSSVLYPGRAQ